MKKNYLSISNVCKSFNGIQVLKDINLNCKKGEFICLLGPSGCGKTTLLRIIAGLEKQDSGVLIQDDIDISHLPAEQRDFGIVFQSYALFPNLTVEKNIGYGLTKTHNKSERIEELLNMVGLGDHAKKYPSQISGGQQQRVALARSIAIEPNLLLLDEPLSALDAKIREHLRHEIKQLQNNLGITTLMVTHDQEEAMSIADKIVVMNEGRIEQIGTPYDIYTNPATPFVAKFVGAMNFIPAKVDNDGTSKCLDMTIECDISSSGKHVKVGIRPEHIRLNTQQNDENSVLAVTEKIEFLGSFVRLYTRHKPSSELIVVDINSEEYAQNDIEVSKEVSLHFEQKYVKAYQMDA